MAIKRNSAGIAIGTTGKVLIMDPGGSDVWLEKKSAATRTIPNPETAQNDIAIWGDDNLLPQQMIRDIENTGVLWAAIETKARIAVGKGPMLAKVANITKDGQEELEFVSNSEIADWMEMSNFFEDSFALGKDLNGLGSAFDQLLLNKGRDKILAFMRTDASECRFRKMNPSTRRSESVVMNADWAQYAYSNDNKEGHFADVPLLDPKFPLQDLLSRSSGFNFMMAVQYPLHGRKYYPPPLWYSARQWVKMAQGIPDIKEAMVRNQITLNYIVEIHPDFWKKYDPRYATAPDAEKLRIQEEFYGNVEEYLTGGKNAYKSLFSTMVTAADGTFHPGIKITSINDQMKEGKLLVDSAAANSEILFAMMMNPALIGADTPGGPYSGGAGSGSNIREAYLIQVMMLELERKLIGKRFMLAKHFNKWDKDLVLRFPNQILTTLNTGANSQATA